MGSPARDCQYADLTKYGCVYCGHHSCKQTWSAFTVTRNEVLKRTGVPILGLQGDSWIRSMTPIGVIQEELEQFMNNVVAGKRGRRRRKGAVASGSSRVEADPVARTGR